MRDEQIDLRAVIWILKLKSDYFNTCQHPNSDVTGGKARLKVMDNLRLGILSQLEMAMFLLLPPEKRSLKNCYNTLDDNITTHCDTTFLKVQTAPSLTHTPY